MSGLCRMAKCPFGAPGRQKADAGKSQHSRFFILLPVLKCGESFLPGKKQSRVASTHALLGRGVSGLQETLNIIGMNGRFGGFSLIPSCSFISSSGAGGLAEVGLEDLQDLVLPICHGRKKWDAVYEWGLEEPEKSRISDVDLTSRTQTQYTGNTRVGNAFAVAYLRMFKVGSLRMGSLKLWLLEDETLVLKRPLRSPSTDLLPFVETLEMAETDLEVEIEFPVTGGVQANARSSVTRYVIQGTPRKGALQIQCTLVLEINLCLPARGKSNFSAKSLLFVGLRKTGLKVGLAL
ncbi:hypothetical protein MJG53_012975 [Ovis ammon polii x Ovis aries]|uniref:Uncharacterized protein n=1 Tax=Ovis ammon polii x Ovis aries TaxID=2918886 RepID=A0ACB9UMA9_9CETA|nr:hypothetical protein MJG53_012975 [Ovis ammon polii x Ovis aries]